MLILCTCLLSQLAPADVPSPTFDDFKVVCQALKVHQIAVERKRLELMKEPDQFTKPSRVEKAQIRKLIQAGELELKRMERDETLLPVPQVIVQNMEVGQIGELFSQVHYAARVPLEKGDVTPVERVEIRPATLTVLKSFRPKAIVCVCDDIEFVLLHWKGPVPVNGTTLQTQGIYRVSGWYKVAGKQLLAVESWNHNAEWQKKITRPQPNGRIELGPQPPPDAVD